MTDAEKLEKIAEYVKNMAPIFRIALLFDDETMAYNRGYDQAAWDFQQDLKHILEET